MKAALCLYGKVGGGKGKDGLGRRIDFIKCFESFREHVISVNDCDVFMHCWDTDIRDKLIDLYRPVSNLFENQIIFDEDPNKNRIFSRWYSTKQSVMLKNLHERKNKVTYKWVMIARYDLLFFTDIDFSLLEPGYFYAAHWNTPPLISKKDRITGEINKPDRMNRSVVKEGLSDLFFIAPSVMMDNFSKIYNYLGEYGLSSHYAPWKHIKKRIGDPAKVIKYKFYRWFDFEIYRFKICGVYR